MIDHVVLAAPDLAAAVEHVERITGVRPVAGGQHLGLGTRNFLLGLGGGAYLEVIGPDPEQPRPEGPRPFGIDHLDTMTLVAWAVASPGIDERAVRAVAAGYDPGPIVDLSRRTPDGVELRWRLTFAAPGDVAVVPFLIDWGDTPHPSTSAPLGVTILSLSAEHPEPAGPRGALAALGVDLVIRHGRRPALAAELDTPNGRVTLR